MKFFEWIPINVNMPWWTSPVRLAFSLEISHIHIVMHAPIHTLCIYSLASGCKSHLFLSIFAFFHFLLLYYIFFVVKDYFLTHCARLVDLKWDAWQTCPLSQEDGQQKEQQWHVMSQEDRWLMSNSDMRWQALSLVAAGLGTCFTAGISLLVGNFWGWGVLTSM